MRVSVIVPTYRRCAELGEALRSLAVQTYKDTEIIVIDDNADVKWNSDVERNVQDIQNEFIGINLKCIVNSQNFGSAKSRNIGIEASSGEYITFLDDDDIYLPKKIERQVAFMRNGGYDYSITDLYLYNKNEKLVNKRVRNYITEVSADALQKYHLMYHMTGTDTMMFTREFLLKIGGFDEIDLGDEFYLIQKAIEANGNFGYLKGCDVKAYIHTGEGGLSSGDGKINGENVLHEYKKRHFDKLDLKTRKYIKMRHYAVIAFAEIRRGNMLAFFLNAVKSFFCAPVFFVKMVLG